jgi:hypothetical protein
MRGRKGSGALGGQVGWCRYRKGVGNFWIGLLIMFLQTVLRISGVIESWFRVEGRRGCRWGKSIDACATVGAEGCRGCR